MPVVLSYGGGTNSTALLVGLHERGERPDLILFADTGGEKPETYKHVETVSAWCLSIGFPAVVTVQSQDKSGNYYTLEERCIKNRMLPSIAYGFKACSEKHKRRPQDRFVNNWPPAKETFARGGRVVKLIGYDADEARRAKIANDSKYEYKYPLIEWDWGRDECVDAIARAGLPQPGKSSCFFCPSSKKAEIFKLAVEHPDLARRCIQMEDNAELRVVAGLGRRYAWKDYLASEKDRLKGHVDLGRIFGPEEINVPSAVEFCDVGKTTDCGCYDGDDAE